jgi:mevalonate kinase
MYNIKYKKRWLVEQVKRAYTNHSEGRAHAKLILGGEHSVVYGTPAVVLPVPLSVIAKVAKNDDNDYTWVRSKLVVGNDREPSSLLDGYFRMVRLIQDICYIPISERALNIEILSDIPVRSGLGSSAAVANAIATAVLKFYKGNVPKDTLYQAVHLAECYAHGNPSGMDMIATSENAPIVFKRNLANPNHPFQFKKVPIAGTYYFVTGLTGIEVMTKTVVEKFAQRLNQNRQHDCFYGLNDFDDAVSKMLAALKFGNLKALGEAMCENHQLLMQYGVSSPALDHLVSTSISSGALGAKLTGKGIGGAMIALCDTLEVANTVKLSLLNQGANRSYGFSISKNEIVEF